MSLRLGGMTRVTLLGEQAASKTAGWGSNPHARADCRRGSTEKGVRLVSGTMLVRIQSSALFVPMLSRNCIGLSEGPDPGSILDQDNGNMPCGCGGRMAAFEAVGRGSIPRWGILVRDGE